MSDRYDAGYINDFGGGDTEWWTDYLRAEVERANDFHADIHEQTAARIAALEAENERLRKALLNELTAIEQDRRWAEGSDLMCLIWRSEAIAQVLEIKP